LAVVWGGAAAALLALARTAADPPEWLVAVRRTAWLPVGFAVAVLVVGLVAYPVFDDRRSTGGGSDADDAVLLVIAGLRDGRDPYVVDTYLGNPPTTGPGTAFWFFPFATQATYPIGIALAVAVTIAVLRMSHGGWDQAGLVALLVGASVPFWEGVGQGSDHLVFACSLVWAACYLRPRPRPLDPTVTVLAAVAIGTLATTRTVFAFVPALAAAAAWWRNRRAALLFGGVGTAAVVLLHAGFISRSGWDGYEPIQQLVVKSDEDLGVVGQVVVVASIAAAAVGVVLELRRRAEARVDVVLLLAVAGPMSAIAVAGLLTAESTSIWSAGNYLLDGLVLGAYWFTTRALLPEPRPARQPPSG
jgi:hypothetical protein